MHGRLLEPEGAQDLLGGPEGIRDAADESKCRRPRSGLSIRNDFLHEPFIFGGFAVVQWWTLHDLPGGKPDKCLWSKKPTGKVEIDFVR